ncbi:S8 family serine peptidase [Streptomyces sp. NPDC015220]|uniref:S8 family serine peptidase n=1 Tax=Streptomyces sp. NPDC015220 TaxID=3364947 RepID=UPI0036F976A2
MASAAALLLCAAVAPAAAAPASPGASPAPSSSAGALRLPVVPARLGAMATACTGGSGTVMTQVPWAQRLLGLGRAGLLTDGAGVTVGVVDTGVSTKAAALSGRVTARPDAGSDCVGHGTFVAGLIAAAPRSGVGFAGVAPGARIFAARGTDATGTADASTVARGIRAAVDAGCRVVTVSAALAANSSALSSAVRYATAHDVLLVAPAVPDDTSAGRDRTSSATPFWPAAAPGVLSVVDFGVDGKHPDGALQPLEPDLAAPGDRVSGIGPAGDGHFVGSGASFAAAYVAGAAALVRAYRPGLTAAQTADRLERTGYPADVPRLDVDGALTGVLSPAPATEPPAATAFHAIAAVHDGGTVRRAGALTAGCAALALALAATTALRRRARAGTGEHA